MSLPIVKKVKKTYEFHDPDAMDHVGYFTIVAPDTRAGRAHRYSVIRIWYQDHHVSLIGQELRWKDAKRIAKSKPQCK